MSDQTTKTTLEKYQPATDVVIRTFAGGHQFTLAGVMFAGVPTDAEWIELDDTGKKLARAEPFVRGDLARMFVKRTKAKTGRTVRDLLAEYAAIRGLSQDSMHEHYCVAEFFPIEHRRRLTWSHHRIVWAEVGGPLHKSLAWLDRAQAGAWLPAELRRQLRAARELAAGAVLERTLPALVEPEIQRFEDWCSARLHEVTALTPAAARSMLEALPAVVAYIDGLRGACAKESIEPEY